MEYLSLPKKVVAYKTTESWTTVPHVTYVYQADVSKMLEIKRAGITLNTVFLKIIVEAIKAAPQINAHIKYNRKRVTGKVETIDSINISMPWVLEGGETVTINLRNFENKSLFQMQEYINDVKRRAQNCNIQIPLRKVAVGNLIHDLKRGHIFKALKAISGATFGKNKTRKCSRTELKRYKKTPVTDKITIDDLCPGTITVSNIGSLYKGKGFFGLIEIIPPQIFAIGVGAIQGTTCPLTLCFDHRALNFNQVVPFLEKLDFIFENIVGLIDI
ncbi:MAG: 2-oxo acid dehydrogenase subunit E2 [Christensenellaceae bacterium]|jgi:pyruvate dehydrogenase E2 component (dihydrolipoamide acetyltransferase)|nr:2-oxo acid dehydrogenase subunit E2 [Christensenellaceae bacterium]